MDVLAARLNQLGADALGGDRGQDMPEELLRVAVAPETAVKSDHGYK